MSFYNMQETNNRLENVKKILKKNNLDAAVVYFDQVNVADGWYLTGWCGQFEKGAVLVLADSDPLLLGGPECEPFAKMCSAISDVRCFKCDVTRSVSKMTEIERRGGKRWDKPKKAEKSRDCGGGKF